MDDIIPVLLAKADSWGSWVLVVAVLVGVIVWQHILYRTRLQVLADQIDAEKAERQEAQQEVFNVLREQTDKQIASAEKMHAMVEFLNKQRQQ